MFGQTNKKVMLETERFSYQPERKVLNTLIDKIFKRNSGQFQDRDEIFDVFAKAMITGNILPMARLIENTFGVGTLRTISNLDHDIEAQTIFVDTL